MPHFIRLVRFTQTGAKDLKQFPARRAEFIKSAKKLGIRVVGEYVTTGRYDIVTILDAPDLNSVLKLTTTIAAQGRTTSETMSAVTADQFSKIVKSA